MKARKTVRILAYNNKRNDVKKILIFTILLLWPISVLGAETSKGYLTISCDDATKTQYTNGLRIAEKYGISGTLFVATANIIEESGPNELYDMDWKMVSAFQDAGWEIGSHTHTHPHMTEISKEQVSRELTVSKNILESRTGTTPISYASPHGLFNNNIVDEAMEHYKYHLRAWDGNNGRNPTDQFDRRDIGRMDVSYDMTPEQVCGEMRQAALDNTWLILIFHKIVPGKPKEYQVSNESFEEMMTCASQLRSQGIIELNTVQETVNLLFSMKSSN